MLWTIPVTSTVAIAIPASREKRPMTAASSRGRSSSGRRDAAQREDQHDDAAEPGAHRRHVEHVGRQQQRDRRLHAGVAAERGQEHERVHRRPPRQRHQPDERAEAPVEAEAGVEDVAYDVGVDCVPERRAARDSALQHDRHQSAEHAGDRRDAHERTGAPRERGRRLGRRLLRPPAREQEDHRSDPERNRPVLHRAHDAERGAGHRSGLVVVE
jgi:hypothetical protein